MTQAKLLQTVASSLCLVLVSCSGGGSNTAPAAPVSSLPPPPPPPPSPPPAPPPVANSADTTLKSTSQAVRFLNRATFGGRPRDVNAAINQDVAEWLAAEFAKPATLYLPDVLAAADASGRIPGDTDSYLAWDKMIMADDQLRQRMVFALSQILVVSDFRSGGPRQARVAYYRDVLSRNAFGNYRTLLEDVTYAPEMGAWLTYLKNRKGDPASGRMPDENYARELMQLFSIGLIELNLDGTPKLNAQGQQVELFDGDDVAGLARVFTGLSFKGSTFTRAATDGNYSPMEIYPKQHSPLEKSFLNLTIPAATTGENSITMALDEIFAQPSVAPFISRQLIQRFTASSPEPAYVARVATAFNAGLFTAPNGRQFGTGERGDLQATLAAVLLDPSLYDPNRASSPADGKIREPILRFIHWVRAFDNTTIISQNEYLLRHTGDPARLDQHPFRAPSVFNYYRPGYILSNSETGDRNLTAPEFQLINATSVIGYFNFMTDFAAERTNTRTPSLNTFAPDYSAELAMAYDSAALVDHLDLKLTGGLLNTAEKAEMIAVLDTLRARSDTPANQAEDRQERVHLAVIMLVNSSAYTVIR